MSLVAEREQALLVFLLLHLIIGAFLPLARDVRPVFFSLFERASRDLVRRLDRPGRSGADLFMRGLIAAGVMVLFGYLFGAIFDRLAGYPYGGVVWVVFLWLATGIMAPLKLQRVIEKRLAKDTDQERRAVAELIAPYVSLRTEGAEDSHGLIRKTMAWCAVGANTRFVAPLVYFAVCGAKGAMVYVAVYALRRACGETLETRKRFGRVVRGADMLLNLVPAALTSFLIACAALFVSRANPLRALKLFMTQGMRYRDGLHGWPVATLAGALGVTLGGDQHGWVGPKEATAKVSVSDFGRGILLCFVVFIFVMVLVACATILHHGGGLPVSLWQR